ncbi:hypothetical protein 000TH008_74 [Bacillus phage 000TH008]|nr:hypothetical protein 000TH008_74 [Bacillus phage 000TH008]QQO40768.1 hypothetical protein 000TH009_74 [Bacillus phage 000TH009]
MINLTISPKELIPGVTYVNPTSTFVLGKKKEEVEDRVLFMAETLKREVMCGEENQKIKKIKKLKKLLKVSLTVCGVGMQISPKVFAAGTTAVKAGGTAITPAVVMEFGLTLALITVSVGVALSMSLLALAGVYRMMRKREEATAWSTDIIKGLVQVLVSIPIVYLLFYLTQTVFKNLPVLSGLF